MNKLVKCSAAALLAASLFSMSGQSVNAATGYQRLTHNAYAYTYNGKRANKKLYRKGSRVRVIGSIKLNGKKYKENDYREIINHGGKVKYTGHEDIKAVKHRKVGYDAREKSGKCLLIYKVKN